jgi:peroxiredoxin
MDHLASLVCDAEDRWIEAWVSGPTKPASNILGLGAIAPDATLFDHTGRDRTLSEFWQAGPCLLIFWRHFGCGCGVERASLLAAEAEAFAEAGLTVVIVGQGEPERASAYRTLRNVEVPILCDPTGAVYDAYGIGHWQPEQVLFDAPESMWAHDRQTGLGFQESRRKDGRPAVDDPWRATAEFVISAGGTIRLGYSYQYCEDFPDPRVLTAAARLSRLS